MSVLGNELAHNCWGRQWDGLCGCLSNGHPVDQRDSNGLAPLQICAGLGWTSAVSKLLKHGADVHLTCPLGWTALMQAVRNGHTDTAVVLLDAGANIAHRNALGWDVLSLAISSNNYTLLTKLVHMAKTSDLSSALAMACQMGNIEAVKLLLNYEADVNQKLPNSELTPLMLAASGGHETIVEILLHHRANPHLLSSYKLTAFDMAFENRQDAAAALLSCFKSPVIHNHLGFPVSPHYFHNNQNVMHSPCLSNELLLNVRSPILPSSTAKQASPQVFKFPESPNFYCVQNGNPHNVNVISPYSLFPHSPAHFFPPLCHCGSPSFVSSPIVPSWMFSSCLSPYTGKTKPMVKKTKRIKIWWKKLKLRCNRKGKKLRVEVHMTVDQDRSLDDQKFLELLSLLNLDSLAPLFKRHEIDAETFRHLGKKDLEEMGILDQALQLSILKKISILNRNNMTCGAL